MWCEAFTGQPIAIHRAPSPPPKSIFNELRVTLIPAGTGDLLMHRVCGKVAVTMNSHRSSIGISWHHIATTIPYQHPAA